MVTSLGDKARDLAASGKLERCNKFGNQLTSNLQLGQGLTSVDAIKPSRAKSSAAANSFMAIGESYLKDIYYTCTVRYKSTTTNNSKTI